MTGKSETLIKDIAKELDPDLIKAEEYNAEIKTKGGVENPRIVMKLNFSDLRPFAQVIEFPEMPPLLVVVVRADRPMRTVALGLLEEAKDMLKGFLARPKPKSSILAPGAVFPPKLRGNA